MMSLFCRACPLRSFLGGSVLSVRGRHPRRELPKAVLGAESFEKSFVSSGTTNREAPPEFWGFRTCLKSEVRRQRGKWWFHVFSVPVDPMELKERREFTPQATAPDGTSSSLISRHRSENSLPVIHGPPSDPLRSASSTPASAIFSPCTGGHRRKAGGLTHESVRESWIS